MSILKTLTTGTLAVLAMASTLSAKDFSGAELYTNEEYTYGKFEARMKMAAASGTVSSMFLYQNGSEQASAQRWVEALDQIDQLHIESFALELQTQHLLKLNYDRLVYRDLTRYA